MARSQVTPYRVLDCYIDSLDARVMEFQADTNSNTEMSAQVTWASKEATRSTQCAMISPSTSMPVRHFRVVDLAGWFRIRRRTVRFVRG